MAVSGPPGPTGRLPLLLLLLLPAGRASEGSPGSLASGWPPLARLAGQRAAGLVQQEVGETQEQQEHEGDEGAAHVAQHAAGSQHGHEHVAYDGHRHRQGAAGPGGHRHALHTHTHEDGTEHAHQLPVYDSIKNEQVDVLTQIERLYSEFQSQSYEFARTHQFPLVSLVESSPHSMTVMVSPKKFRPDIMVRLLYERVPLHRRPCVQHLDDPVIEYYPMIRDAQTYTFSELPRGKYIVCGEAMSESDGEIMQSSCFETKISRRDDNSLQNGVKAMIGIAFVIVALVVVYAIFYQVYKKTCSSRHVKQEKS